MPRAERLPFEAVPEVFTLAAALANGFTEKQLRGRRVARLRDGHYADAALAAEWHTLAAAVTGEPAGSALCDITAAQLWGLPKPWSRRNDNLVHVCVPAPRRASRRRDTAVHQRILLPGDVVRRADLPVTSPARTFLDLAACTELEELVALGDAILRTGCCGRQQLADRVGLAVGRRGRANALTALAMLDGRSQSPPESLIRVRAVRAGLPPPEPQCPVVSLSGQVIAHVDLGYREYKVGLEHEGRHHTEPRQFAIDTERYTAISAAGWLILRSSAPDLANGSARILAKLRTTLMLRGWDGKSST